jgi:hypothetical protein
MQNRDRGLILLKETELRYNILEKSLLRESFIKVLLHIKR